jgi:hypothetical protein
MGLPAGRIASILLAGAGIGPALYQGVQGSLLRVPQMLERPSAFT